MTFSLRIIAREVASAVAVCGQFADTKSAVPILKAVRVSVQDGIASFVATDTMQTAITRAACDGSGVACMDINFLAPKLSTLRPNEPVTIDGDGKTAAISQGKTRWKVPCYIDDFPLEMAKPVDGQSIAVGKDFIAALKNVRPGVLNQDSGHAYSGVWLDGKAIVAVDGRHMRIQEHTAELPQAILTPTAADRIATVFKDGASATINGGRAQFTNSDITVITRLMEGKPMDWRVSGLAKFRGSAVHSCEISGEEFAMAVKRAAAIGQSGEKAGSFVNMQLRMRENKIEIYTRNAAGEEGEDEISTNRSGDVEIGINGGILMDCLATLPTGTLRLSHGVNSDAIIIQPIDNDTNVRIIFPRMFT